MAWMYTKYKMRVIKQADFSGPLHMETWIEKQDKVRIWQDLKVSVGNEVYALGRLESCVFHLEEQKIGKLSDIEMPQDVVCEEKIALDPFAKIKRDVSDMEYVLQSFYGDEIRMYQKSTGDTYQIAGVKTDGTCLLYTSPSPRD